LKKGMPQSGAKRGVKKSSRTQGEEILAKAGGRWEIYPEEGSEKKRSEGKRQGASWGRE